MLLCITTLSNYCLKWLLMCLFIATTNDAQQVDEVSAVSLEVQDYLNKVCNGNGSDTCHLVNSVPQHYRNLDVRNCMCDDQCQEYKDCCADATTNSSPRVNTSFECVKTMIDGHVYMVTTCPPSKSNFTSPVVDLCLNRDPQLMSVEMLLSTPVTNANTGRTYRNAFCALCNDVKEFQMWDIFVSYDGLLRAFENFTISSATATPLRSANDILDTIRPDDNALLWRFTNKNANISDEICYLNSTIPTSLSTVVRTCVPNVIDVCASDRVDDEQPLSKKCVDGDLAYVIVGDKTYKNRFCAECNGVALNSTAKNCFNASGSKLNATVYQPFIVNIADERILKIPSSCAELRRSLPGQNVCPRPAEKATTKKRPQCFPIRKDTNRPCLVALTLPKNSSELTFVDNGQYVIFRATKYKMDDEVFYRSKNDDSSVYICGTYVDNPNKLLSFLDDIFTRVLIKLSIFCLILQLVLFLLLPDMRNLSGKNLACFSLTLLIFLFSFEIGPIVRGLTKSCYLFGIVLHYSLLSCFAWMLIMSYDCWLSLYRATAQFRSSAGKGHSVRFAVYCLLCWTAPLPLVGYGAYLEHLATHDGFCSLQPGYGLPENCFIYNSSALYYLFVIPASISFVGNILFFAHTAYMIYLSQRKTVNPNTRNDFMLYTRLALMMGLTWTLGSLTTLTGSPIIGLMFTIMNMSQGIFIFFGFTFKKKYLRSLSEKYSGNRVLSKTLSTFATTSTKVASENKTVSETL